jgi:crossover junction endodeoxyribonuclease RuvC
MVGIKHQIITPASWKKAMRVPADKDGARRMAIQQFPNLADRLNRKKDEHRAEALLMAAYAKAVE